MMSNCVVILKCKSRFFHQVLTNSFSYYPYTVLVQEVRKIYQIYIEYIFLLNFVFLYSVWNVSLVLVSCTVTQKKLLLAGFSGAVVSCFCLLLPVILWLRLFLGSILAFLISFGILSKGTRRKQIFGRYLSITFLMAVLLGGSIGLLQKKMGEDSFSFLQMLGLPIFVSFGIKILLRRYLPKKRRLLYNVTLFCEGTEYTMKGLLDTGNSLVEPISRKAVCIVGREVFEPDHKKEGVRKEFLSRKFRVIPYHSVGKENGILCGYEMDRLIIDTDERKVIIEKPMIGISDVPVGSRETYQMILQPELLREGEK